MKQVIVWTTLVFLSFSFLPVAFSSKQVRLVGGQSPASGRVEVYHNGTWGTVCDDSWDLRDSHVVCRMFGYSSALQAVQSAGYGQGTGAIWLDNVHCNGKESSLINCPNNGWGRHNCGHGEDAGVMCLDDTTTDFRVRGTNNPAEGRIEIYLHGSWYTVCDTNWDLRDAHVVCHAMGYKRALQATCCAKYGSGIRRPPWKNIFDCTGNETSLFKCSLRTHTYGSCYRGREAGVVCSNAFEPVRLQSGSSVAEGRVEVYHKGAWGTVCDLSWDLKEGHVICRMLGYSHALNVSCCSHYGPGRGSISLKDLRCTGSESSLFNCAHLQPTNQYCSHMNDAGVSCSVKARLVNSRSPSFGRVEIFYNGVWGRVCASRWDLKDGRVICRMLGYSHVFAVGGGTKYWRGNGPIWMSNVRCTGNEESIATCPHQGWGVHDCDQNNNAWVVCSNSPAKIRLKGGEDSAEGRVEVYYNGAWGTVCDNYWDIRESRVVCRMLGYNRAMQATCCSKYGRRNGLAILQHVGCTGSEHSLFHCSHNRLYSTSCTGDQLAGVVCTNDTKTVRIRNGNARSKGRVEVFKNGAWGTVCGKEWDLNHGHAVCRMMGYYEARQVNCCAKYGQGTGPIWLYDLNCYRREKNLNRCLFGEERTQSCTHSDDGSVTCSVKARLMGSSHNTHGRVEVLYNGVWGRVCGSSWDLQDGKVVCRMLGYTRALAAGGRYYGKGDGPIWMSYVRCTGTEESIATCRHNGWGVHSCGRNYDAWVICSNSSVRLVGGSSNIEGRVEIKHGGIWGTVCDNHWDLLDGHVICRTLGYGNALQVSRSSKYGQGSGRIWLDNVQCTGSESSINSCPNSGWGIHSCTHSQEAGVKCAAQVRLADGVSPSEGRLQVYYNEAWGKVCYRRYDNDDTWSVNNSHVVCRMLGYSHALHTMRYARTVYGMKGESAWLSRVRCNGNESNLANCPSARWGVSHCISNYEVGLICSTESVSLVDGSSNAEGRVEVLHNGVWGRVCAQHWDVNDGHVVCRMLGYSYALEADYYQNVRRSKRSTSLNNVQCKGTERNLLNCAHSGISVQGCNDEFDAGVKCAVPVRLAGSSSPAEGRIEVYYNRIWGAVKGGRTWNNADAVCRMLEFTHALAPFMPAKNTPYGVKTGYTWLQGIRCTGRETNLASCPRAWWGQHSSTHDYDAAVVCSNKTVRMRLADTSSSLVGRIEIFSRGNWGGICFTNWTMSSSDLVCRTLGYPRAISYAPVNTRYNQEDSYFLLNNVQCTGREKTLNECLHQALNPSDCTMRKEVLVGCAVPIRLVGGTSSAEGRVELFYHGVWGSVCADDWDLKDGHVVCRMLGYKYALQVSRGRKYVETNGYVFLKSLKCTGIENNIMSCPHGTGYCSDNDGAGVVCYNPETPTVRLVGGSSPLVGRAEIFYQGKWGEICFRKWTMSSSHLVCRRLGYPRAISYAPVDSRHTPGDSDFLLNSIQCNGGERTLNGCLHQVLDPSACPERKVVEVGCSVPIRLMGGTSSVEGRVELFYNGAWGSVCADGWDLKDGHVVCRMMGYEYAVEVSRGRRYGETKGYVFLKSLRCTGIENSIISCPHGTGYCSDNHKAGVVCYKPEAPTGCVNCSLQNKTTGSPEHLAAILIYPKTLSGYIVAVSFLSSLVFLLLFPGAVLVYRYKLHQKIMTKQTSSLSNRAKENADEEKSPDYEEVNAIRRANGNRDTYSTRNLTDDDTGSGTTAGGGGATLHPQQTDVKPKKKRNDGNKLLFKKNATQARGQNEKSIELSNTVGRRQDQSSTNVYQPLLGRDDGSADNREEPVYSNVLV